jgi:hypothetical protein
MKTRPSSKFSNNISNGSAFHLIFREKGIKDFSFEMLSHLRTLKIAL